MKEALLERGQETISRNYNPRPVVFERGQGLYLYDIYGRKYLDFAAGIAVCSLGHNHPKLVQALKDQVEKLLHVSNMFFSKPQIELQDWLVQHSFASRIFFCNSGTEANEAAIKLARRYHQVYRKTNRTEIVAAQRSFHGRTLASLAATGQPKYWKGFAPLPPGFTHIPYNDIQALESTLSEKTAALILEPVQGEGGIIPGEMEYLKKARALCDQMEIALIFDEVQCGVGRIGHLWAYEHYGIEPDIVTWAKGIAGGVPMGVMASNSKWSWGFEPGAHASTFGGNPLATRAALTTLEIISDQNFLENVRIQGARLKEGLKDLAQTYPIREVRGLGLMMGAEVGEKKLKPIITAARDEGLIINGAGGNTLRFVPPLIVHSSEIDEALQKLKRALQKVF